MIDYTRLIALALGATTVDELRDVVVELLEVLQREPTEIEFLELQAKLLPPLQELAEEQRTEIERLRNLFIEQAARNEGELIKRDDEVERLRGLLQEALDADRDHYATAMAVLMASSWHRRIRKALGEQP